jgi:5-methylcytosine-specific restriction endonuclease McrA
MTRERDIFVIPRRSWTDPSFRVLWAARSNAWTTVRVEFQHGSGYSYSPELRDRKARRTRFRKIVDKLFAAVVARDGCYCAHCGRVRGVLLLDHVLPISWDGTNDLFNLQLLCASCNGKKGASLPFPPRPVLAISINLLGVH